MKLLLRTTCAAALLVAATDTAHACDPIPQPNLRHLAFSSFNYSSGEVTVNYNSSDNVSCAALRVALVKIADVTPGTAFSHTFVQADGRVDITGVASNSNGSYSFITPIWHPACSGSLPAATAAPLYPCGSSPPGTCSVEATVTCGIGSVTARASGHTGGCFNQSATGTAKAVAASTDVDALSVVTTTLTTDTKTCP